MSVEADGSLVRNITAVYSPGVQAMTAGLSHRPARRRSFGKRINKSAPTRFKRQPCAKPERGWVATFREVIVCCWCVGRAIPKSTERCVMSIAVETLSIISVAPRPSEISEIRDSSTSVGMTSS